MSTNGSFGQDEEHDAADLVRSVALSSARLWEEVFERLRGLERVQQELRETIARLEALPPVERAGPALGSGPRALESGLLSDTGEVPPLGTSRTADARTDLFGPGPSSAGGPIDAVDLLVGGAPSAPPPSTSLGPIAHDGFGYGADQGEPDDAPFPFPPADHTTADLLSGGADPDGGSMPSFIGWGAPDDAPAATGWTATPFGAEEQPSTRLPYDETFTSADVVGPPTERVPAPFEAPDQDADPEVGLPGTGWADIAQLADQVAGAEEIPATWGRHAAPPGFTVGSGEVPPPPPPSAFSAPDEWGASQEDAAADPAPPAPPPGFFPASAAAPPPPPGFAAADAPPPPPGFAAADAPPPPPGFAAAEAPGPPPGFSVSRDITTFGFGGNGTSAPPPPPGFGPSVDAPPPPPGFGPSVDAPPPPPGFGPSVDAPPLFPGFAPPGEPVPPPQGFSMEAAPAPADSDQFLLPGHISGAVADDAMDVVALGDLTEPPPPPPGFTGNGHGDAPPPPPPGFGVSAARTEGAPPPPPGFNVGLSGPRPPAPPSGFSPEDFSGDNALGGNVAQAQTPEGGSEQESTPPPITPDFFARAGRRRR